MKKIADDLSGSADELMTKAMGNITGKAEPDNSGKTKADWAKQQEDAQKQIDAWMAKAKAAGAAAKQAQELENAIKKITEATQQSKENILGIQEGSYVKELAMIQNDVAEYQKAGVSKTKIEEYVAARTTEIRAAVQQKIQDDISVSLENIKALHEGSFAHEIALLNKKAEEYRKEGATETDITAYIVARTAELRATAAKQIQDETKTSQENIIGITESSYAKEMALLSHKIEEYRKAGAQEEDIKKYAAVREMEIMQTVSKEKLDAERDLYKDLREYSGEYFEATKRLIEEQARKYRELGIDEVVVAAWVKEETINAFIEMGKKSDDYRDGVAAAFAEIQRDAMTMGQAAYESVKEFSTQAQSTLSSVFFDAAKGELKSFSDYFTSFFDTILKKFTDICAQMVVEWLMAQARMAVTSAGGGSGILGTILGAVGGLFGGGTSTATAAATAGSSSFNTGALNLGLSAVKFADGGWIPEPVLGRGLTSGRYYSFAERESERVMTKKDISNINGGSRSQSFEKQPQPVLNARIINVWDRSVVGDFLGTDAGEQIIMNIVKRNQGALAH